MLGRLCKSIIVLALVVTSVSVALPAGEAHAGCDDTVMGFPTWYRGLDCDNGHVNLDGKNLGEVAMIVGLNVIDVALRIVGIVATAMIIYSGYLFMMATGEGAPTKVAKARTALVAAIAGLIIAVSAAFIIAFIVDRVK